MPTAFVLVNTEIGSQSAVLSELKEVERVKEAVAVYGVYDIMVRVASKLMDEVKQTIVWNIRKMDRVRATLTKIIDANKGVPKARLYPYHIIDDISIRQSAFLEWLKYSWDILF